MILVFGLRILDCGVARRLGPPLLVVAGALLAGCLGDPANPASTQPATAIDPATTQPAYWLAQPSVAQLRGRDFTKLWDACERAIQRMLMKVDRRDWRRGLLTSEPMISRQFFELWRNDPPAGIDLAESSLANIRRTVFFEFRREDDGTFVAAPKVLVERWARVEAKLQATVDYDPTYWYPLRRDEAMERRLAQWVGEGITPQ
jgi:hypothetical protein